MQWYRRRVCIRSSWYLAIDNLGDDMCCKNGISRSLLLFADRIYAPVHTYNTTVYIYTLFVCVCEMYAKPIEIRTHTEEMPRARTMRLNG